MDSALSLKDILTLEKMAKTLRFLCADMVQEANSGHPGRGDGLGRCGCGFKPACALKP